VRDRGVEFTQNVEDHGYGLVAGCSTKAWYEGLKVNAQNDCRRQPSGDTESCLARADVTGLRAKPGKASQAPNEHPDHAGSFGARSSHRGPKTPRRPASISTTTSKARTSSPSW
jgi:hypothetical protein